MFSRRKEVEPENTHFLKTPRKFGFKLWKREGERTGCFTVVSTSTECFIDDRDGRRRRNKPEKNSLSFSLSRYSQESEILLLPLKTFKKGLLTRDNKRVKF